MGDRANIIDRLSIVKDTACWNNGFYELGQFLENINVWCLLNYCNIIMFGFVHRGQGSILLPFMYYRFLSLRYSSRRNPYCKWVHYCLLHFLSNFWTNFFYIENCETCVNWHFIHAFHNSFIHSPSFVWLSVFFFSNGGQSW